MSGKRGLEQVLADARADWPVGATTPAADAGGVQAELLGEVAADPAHGAGDGQAIERTGKAGRPKGAKNRSTAETVRYLLTFGQGPLVGMAKIVNMIDQTTGFPDFRRIAELIGSEREEAAKFWASCARELAPYMHQKLPMAVDIKTGADLKVLIINARDTIDAPPTDPQDLLGGAFGGIIEGDYEELVEEKESVQKQ